MGLFTSRKSSKNLTIEIAIQESRQELTLALNTFAIQTGINLIAAALANCEFQTVVKNKLVKGEEYYLWNVKPNQNQNKVMFLNKLVNELVWNNRCLIVEVNDQLFVADSFNTKERTLYPWEFSSVVVNGYNLSGTYNTTNSIYLEYNNEDMTDLLTSLLEGYKKLITMSTAKYKRAGGRKGIVESGINPMETEEWNAALADLYGDKFKKYFTEENALVVLPNGQKYSEISGEGSKKSTSDVTDIINLTNEAISQAGRALRIPPNLLKGEAVTLDESTKGMLTFAVKPFAELIEKGIIGTRYGKKRFIEGTYLSINTSRIKHIDPFDVAVQADKYIANSTYNVDETRVKLGDLPLNTKESIEYVRTKNYETVKGGEEK